MILLSVLASIAATSVICCLLFYLAVYALPLFAGVTAGVWAYGTGAGWLGGIAVGAVAGLATLLAGHVLLALVRPLWLRLVIAAAFVAPAAIAAGPARWDRPGRGARLRPFQRSGRDQITPPVRCSSPIGNSGG